MPLTLEGPARTMRGVRLVYCDTFPATDALGAMLTAWPWCWRARQRDTAGTAAAGHLGCCARQPTRLVGFRPKGAAKSCRPATARPRFNPGHLRRVTLAAHSFSTAPARPRCSWPGPSGPACRRCAPSSCEESCNSSRDGTAQVMSGHPGQPARRGACEPTASAGIWIGPLEAGIPSFP